MEAKNKRALLFAAALAGLALFLYVRERNRQPSPNIAPPDNDFYSPYYWPTPGIYPVAIPPESTVNIYMDNPLAGGLAYQYMPVFGLVGMTGVQG